MWAARICKRGRVLGVLLTICLLAGTAAPCAIAADLGRESSGTRGAPQVILLVVDELQMEDVLTEMESATRLFSEQGGAGFMHVSRRVPTAAANQPHTLLQLVAVGLQQMEELMQQTGIVVHRLPEPTMYVRDGIFPGGRRLDWKVAAAHVGSLIQAPADQPGRFFVLEFDELAKVKAEAGEMAEQQYLACRQDALETLNLLLAELLKLAGHQTMVIVAGSGQGPQLLPLLAAGGNIPARSFLSSASTRRPGIVTSADTAVTIHRFLGVAPSVKQGGNQFLAVSSSENIPEQLQQMWEQMKETRQRRPAVLALLAVSVVSLLAAVLIVRLLRKRLPRRTFCRAASLPDWGATAVSVTPLLLLLPDPLAGMGWSLGVFAVGIMITYGLMRIRNRVKRCGVIAAMIVGVVTGDCLLGGTLARQSVLSYDPISGIRFYGIGNEYMGILVAWLLLGCASLLSVFPKWVVWGRWGVTLLVTGVALLFAWPDLGANAGGTITAAAAAAAVWVCLTKPGRLSGWTSVTVLLSVVLSLLFMFNQHAKLPTHISVAGSLFLHGNFAEIGDIILRKVHMNVRLMNEYTQPALVLASMGVLASLTLQPIRSLAAYRQQYPIFFVFSKAAVWAAVAALLCNDSGVVAAAMILLPFAITLSQFMLAAVIPTPDTTVPAEVSTLDNPDFSIGTNRGR